MKVEGHRKQVVLFLIAVLLPVILLVALTLRIVNQERELALKRVADERRSTAAEIGRDLTSRLDGLARVEASTLAGQPLRFARHDYVNPEVVLIAKIDNARLILPWEAGPKAAASMLPENDSEYGRILRQAESAEFSSKNYVLAAERYMGAAAAARFPAEEGYARLQWARALSQMKREQESLAEYEKVLFLSPEVIDEYGIPLSFYAFEPLLRTESMYPQAVERIGRQLVSAIWLSPAGLYLMRDLVQQIIVKASEADGTAIRAGAEEHLTKIFAQIQVMEQALSLKEDFPRLDLEPTLGPNLKKPNHDGRNIRAETLAGGSVPCHPRRRNPAGRRRFPGGSPPPSQRTRIMRPSMPRMSSSWPDCQPMGFLWGQGSRGSRSPSRQAKASSIQSRDRSSGYFYFLALVVVLSVTLFGAYLLWRDVRREVLMAQMRSRFVSSVSHELKTP